MVFSPLNPLSAITTLLSGFPLFYPVKFPDFPKIFPRFFLSFHEDILVKKTYLFFLDVAST